LVGEVEVAVSGKDQIVETLEALAMRPFEIGLDLPRARIEQQ